MLGYSLGYVGQGSSYNFISTFIVLFLTDCVGMNPTMAGAITSIALFAEVILGMLIGNYSDTCTSKMGRRRPFILIAGILMPIVLILITHNIKADPIVSVVYYLVLSILFRFAFSCFEIPNNAFGSELVSDYDGRTRLRTNSRIFSIFGNACGYILPLVLLEMFDDNIDMGWQVSGILIAIISGSVWITEVLITKGKGIILDKADKPEGNHIKNIVVNYVDLLKLKPSKYIVIYKAAFASAFGLYNIVTVYYLHYSVGLSNGSSSFMYAFSIIMYIIATPIVNKMALSLGKDKQQMYTMLMLGIFGIIVFFFMPSSVVGALVFMVVFSVTNTAFWQISTSIFYDVVEVDEFVNGRRREGDLMSLVSVLGSLMTAIMTWVFGVALEFFEYVPGQEIQSSKVVLLLNSTFILIPGILGLIGAMALKLFPINKKRFVALQKAIECKKNGEDYSMYMDELRPVIGKNVL